METAEIFGGCQLVKGRVLFKPTFMKYCVTSESWEKQNEPWQSADLVAKAKLSDVHFVANSNFVCECIFKLKILFRVLYFLFSVFCISLCLYI